MIYLYGNSWEKFPIKEKEIWKEKKTNSYFMINDLRKKLPPFIKEADLFFSDTPWNKGNVNCFITKANKDSYIFSFSEFYNKLFEKINIINPKICYLEIGIKNKNIYKNFLLSKYKYINEWDILYYKKNPCKLLRGSNIKTNLNFNNLDDTEIVLYALQNEKFNTVIDLCAGKGITPISAFKLKKRSISIELNKRRLAVAIDKINKLGGIFEKNNYNKKY